ncbi:MAG: prealbumin-like fold domain-containing protein, partial [Erysipelotrichaceae bacterium]|nr:prealbumin-like fold domain-containing protein [Erysipelotrichaceae bacterium]
TDTFKGLTSPADKGDGSPEVIGYRMQGSSKYEVPVNGDSLLVKNLTAGSRTDYVLTKCLKSAFNEYGTYELSNNVTATVTPADGKDVHTYKEAAAIGTYERIEPPEPVYTPPAESYKISKYGIYGNRQHVKNKNNISSYDLERLQSGKDLAGLTYHINANANAYIKTLEDGITGTEQDAIDGKFGKKNVTYSLSDSEIYLNDSENPLSQDDYTFTSLEYSIKIQDATYNSESKSFISNNVTYKSSDSLEFYILTDNTSEYKLVATYNLSTDEADIKDYNYISSLTDSSVNFKGNVKGWKIQTSNPYYSVSFDVYPTITLKPTNTVNDAIPTTDNAKISVKNTSILNVVDSSQAYITRSASGTDYVAKVQRNSNISKKVTSAKNYPGIRGYKINWETSMSETYTDESGTLPVRQESGVFYDLIPVGCRADLNSIKVYADGQQLLESEYTIEELQENYKGSNRTLITVRINTPAESNYKMTYTTVHLWEDVLDYGRYVLNSVAYETGNPDIAGGYPDNGGNISDSTVLADLNPNTNDKRFLYSQATHYINALIPLSSGISKKVASADDSSFGVKTIVHPDSTYVYRIRMENASHSTSKNIVIFDSLENFYNKINGETAGKNCDWRGTLESFGLANLEKLGINPAIYLSSTPNLNLATMYTADNAGKITFDSSIWTPIEEFGDISEATAFAIDLSQGIDGKQFELGENRSFSFTVTMRSPQTVNSDEKSPETYNNIYRSFISKDTENQTKTNYYDHQDYTTVIYRTVGDLRFKKINSETNNPIQGIKFNLSGTSFYGTEVNKDIVSDSNGIVYLADLERGTYLLTETDPTADYLKGNDRIVTVNENGIVTISPDDQNNSDISVIKNTPRVHGDLSFLKMDKLNPNKFVSGAVFTLTGTSDYGNKVEKTANSDNSGVVFFEDVEKGT